MLGCMLNNPGVSAAHFRRHLASRESIADWALPFRPKPRPTQLTGSLAAMPRRNSLVRSVAALGLLNPQDIILCSSLATFWAVLSLCIKVLSAICFVCCVCASWHFAPSLYSLLDAPSCDFYLALSVCASVSILQLAECC